MDGTRRVTLMLDADSTIRATYSTKTPTLIIRCRNKQTEVYIVTGVSARSIEGEYNRSAVRIRLDAGSPVRQVWSESTDNSALFAPSAVDFARKLANASKLYFEFTPYSSSAQVATFSVNGLVDKLPEVASNCGWKI
jgi:type VI secretion system protein VasI